jgi:hypothetical protein
MGTGALSPEVKRHRREAITHLNLVSRSRKVELYLNSAKRLHGMDNFTFLLRASLYNPQRVNKANEIRVIAKNTWRVMSSGQ